MTNQINPLKPKRIDALTHEFHDELLVYDRERHKAHCLNKTAAAVWLECSGDATVPEIAKKLKGYFRGSDDTLVRLSVVKLQKAGLLEKADGVFDVRESLNRRDVLKRIRAMAVVALPLVTTMLVPIPAAAASCFPVLHNCTSPAQCCSNHCGLSGIKLVCLP
jgi:hypothetical protein